MSFALRRWRAPRPSSMAVFAVLALLIAACSDSDGATASPAPTNAATEAATAVSTDTPEPTPTESAPPLVVADSDGFELELSEPATRIVSFSPGATEILFAIGAGDQVVAADEFSNYPAAAADLERVSYSAPDPEQVLAFDPDLVILATQQQQSVEQLRGLGLTVLFNQAPESVDGVLENIVLLGRVAGRDDEAAVLVADMRQRLEAIEATIAQVEVGPSVFYELDPTLFTIAPNTFIGGYLSLLRASNVADGAESAFPQLTAEALIAANPEVVLLADAAFGGDPESVALRPGWDAIDAVANGRLYPVDPDISSRPGPRIVEAIERIALLLYPELFE